MVNSVWARCDFCESNIKDKNSIFVPSCLLCKNDMENIFFHRVCFSYIYDEDRRKLKSDFEKQFDKIQCKECECERFTCERVWA